MFAQALWVLGSLLTTFAIAVDGARYLLQRHQIYHALRETVRLQSRAHMHPERFSVQLQQALQQIHVPQPLGWPHSWHAEQLRPNDQDFSLFRDPILEKQLDWPYPTINNFYLNRQHQRNHDSMADKQADIFLANTLSLVFYYAFQPLNPVLRAILKPLQNQATHPYTQQLLAQGLLPLTFEIHHPYASHPVAWPQDPALPYYRYQNLVQSAEKFSAITPWLAAPDTQAADSTTTQLVAQRPPTSTTAQTNTDTTTPVPGSPNQSLPHAHGPEEHQATQDCDHPSCALLCY